MRDWKTRLDKWMRVWDRLPELTRDCFPIRVAAGSAWPAGLPSCPALADFYARCDGGTFGPYQLEPMVLLADPSDGWLAGSPGLDLKLGRWLNLGSHDFGHAILWDADADEVMLYSPDDEEPHRLGRTMSAFLERLFYPSSKSSKESIQMWAEARARRTS